MNFVLLLPLFKKLEIPVLKEAVKPNDKVKMEEGTEQGTVQQDEWDKVKYMEEIRLYLKNKVRLEATLTALHGVVWWQCSRLMQGRC